MADEPQNTAATVPTPGTTPVAADTEQPSDETKNTEAKTFTQDDIDRTVKDRLAREKVIADKRSADLQAQLNDLAEFKKKAEEERAQLEKEREQKETEKQLAKGEYEAVMKRSEERYQESLKKESQRAQEIAAERDTLRTELEKTKIDTAMLGVASNLAVNAQQVVHLLKMEHTISLDPRTNQVLVDGDADTPLDKIVQRFLDKNPHLAKSQYDGKTGAGTPPRGATSPTPGGRIYTRAEMSDQDFYRANRADILKAQREGRIREE